MPNIILKYSDLTPASVTCLSQISEQNWKKARENSDLCELLEAIDPESRAKETIAKKGLAQYTPAEGATKDEIKAAQKELDAYLEEADAKEFQIPFSEPIVLKQAKGIKVTSMQAFQCRKFLKIDFMDDAEEKPR